MKVYLLQMIESQACDYNEPLNFIGLGIKLILKKN